MTYEGFEEKRFPVIKADDHYCLLTIDPRPLQTEDLPKGLFCYDICKSEKTEGPVFKVSQDPVPDLYRWGRLICKDELSFDETGTYTPSLACALRTEDAFTAGEFHNISIAELSQAKGDGMLYRSSFGLIPVYPILDMYRQDDNLYLGFDFYDEEEQFFDHFGDVTVNIDPLPYLHSTIDTNNNGDKILDFLKRSGLGEPTGQYLSSGFCRFPVFRFDARALHAIDPQTFESYANVHGQEPDIHAVSLTDKIEGAAERAGDPANRATYRESTRE